MTARHPTPQVGDIWGSRDKREPGRQVTVIAVAHDPAGFTTVRHVRTARSRTARFVRAYRLLTRDGQPITNESKDTP